MCLVWGRQMNLPPVLAVRASKEDEVVIDIEMSAELEAFHGHFPGHPILPGVVQIDWVARFAMLHLNIEKLSARDFQVKFRNIIRPGNPVSLLLQLDRTRNRLS